MNHRTHFQNQTGSVFSRLECQLACALFLYVRTRRHHRGHIDHSQPPTLQMLNEILWEARCSIWNAARRSGTQCNAMHPDAPLNAYCLVRHLKHSPAHRRWYDEVLNHPEFWRAQAYEVFEEWVYSNSDLVNDLRENGTLALYY